MTPKISRKTGRILIRRRDLVSYLSVEDSDLPPVQVTFTVAQAVTLSGLKKRRIYLDIESGRLAAVRT